MFAEELAKVRECEANAEAMLRQAKLEARETVAAAQSEAAKLVEEAKKTGKQTYDKLVREGEDASEEQYREFLAETKKSCAAMTQAASRQQAEVAAYIAERIVRRVNH